MTFKSRECLFYNFKKCRHDELIYAYPRPHPRIIEEYFDKEGNLQEPVSSVNVVYKPVPFYLKLYGNEEHYEEFNICKNGDLFFLENCMKTNTSILWGFPG